MPGQVLMAGGPDGEEEDLEIIGMWASQDEEGTEVSDSEEEDGSGPPT